MARDLKQMRISRSRWPGGAGPASRSAAFDRSKGRVGRNATALVLAGLFLAGAGRMARGEVLTDPTRPPSAMEAGAGAPGVPAAGGYVLQSVFLSPTRRAALINGILVERGGEIGGARLVTVSETGVVLKTPEGLTTLKLFPGVEKQSRDVRPVTRRGKALKKSKGETTR